MYDKMQIELSVTFEGRTRGFILDKGFVEQSEVDAYFEQAHQELAQMQEKCQVMNGYYATVPDNAPTHEPSTAQ